MQAIDHADIVSFRWGGLVRAVIISSAWLALMIAGLLFVPVRVEWLGVIVPLVLLQAFTYTGLFITAHDAMHGTLMPAHPRLNDLIGHLCVVLFALFSYQKLRTKHADHHRSPASNEDPDYHDGKHSGLLAWYIHFMLEYVTLGQILGMGVVFVTLWLGAGARPENVILFWAVPAILSTWQLFYFGTYLPHRQPSEGYTNRHRAQSNEYPPWLSFITCYHFGYHLEHHEHPFVPWWKLGRWRSEQRSRLRTKP